MKNKAFAIIGSFFLVLVLAVLLALELIFAVSYAQANVDVFTIAPIVAFAAGWERFWVWIYLAADAAYYCILLLIFLELALFLTRTIATTATKVLSGLSGRDPGPIVAKIKKVSLLTIFKWIRLNNVKRGLIAYFGVMLLVFGSGWVAKKVLAANESLVYRSMVTINLESEEQIYDASDELSADDMYDITITANVGNVHIYAVSDETDIKMYFLYDVAAQRENLVWTIDPETNRIDVTFNTTATDYVLYADPVPPAVEIYLPEDLAIGSIAITLSVYGNLTMQYADFDLLDADVAGGKINLATKDIVVGDILLASHGGRIDADVDDCDSVTIFLTGGATADVTFKSIATALAITAATDSDLYLYSTQADTITIGAASGSNLELREVYATDVEILLADADLVYVNGARNYVYVSFNITAVGGSVTTRGVPDDTNG
ncbi:MAG: hypothetical protein V1761_02760 [bacterium]